MATLIPEDPDTLLRRRATAEALTAQGFPTAEKTLATKATRGGGPPFRSFGRIPLYRWGDALSWAQSRLSPPRRSTSEADLQHAALPACPAHGHRDAIGPTKHVDAARTETLSAKDG